MKFEINIPTEVIESVVTQVSDMHNVALHNLGNAMVRNGNIKRNMEIATATKIIYDIISVVTESIRAKENGENPEEITFGNVCCTYIPE